MHASEGVIVARVTILGAGDMGTALVTPLAQNGHAVRLWGTERDSAIVAKLRAGDEHPRLLVRVPAGVDVFAAEESAAALEDADIVVVAITSDAVRLILNRLGAELGRPGAVVTVAKGFDAGASGDDVQLLPQTIAEFTTAPIVAVGGPSKANEVAHGQPTAVTFGSTDSTALALTQEIFSTPVYRVETTGDVAGLEVAAAMKNAYAIAIGVSDGLERSTGRPHHNLCAALFPRAVAEMSALAEAMGGRAETVAGLAGAGDLQVTITSGRNRLLGERIGLGEPPAEAIRALNATGTTVEGYPAAKLGHLLSLRAVADKRLRDGSLPLLDALWAVLFSGAPPAQTLWDAV